MTMGAQCCGRLCSCSERVEVVVGRPLSCEGLRDGVARYLAALEKVGWVVGRRRSARLLALVLLVHQTGRLRLLPRSGTRGHGS